MISQFSTPPRFERNKLRDPVRQAHVYRGREAKIDGNVNKLSISTLNRKEVRRKATRTDAMQRQGLRKTAEKNVQATTNNAFIEFDMRRAFVPKLVVSKQGKSITETIENTHSGDKSIDLNKAVFNEKSIESGSETVNIDKKVLDRIQQLEKDLIVMKDRVKNDTETIDDLKTKVLQKDKELTEFSFNNQSLADNKIAIKNQETIAPKEDFSSITPISIEIQRTEPKRVQKAGRKQFGADPQTKDMEIYAFENDNAQPMNKPDKDNPTYPMEENPDYDQLDVDDRNNKEEYGQGDPGDLVFGINEKDNFMNYDEYKKKLHEERIADGIDWKKFNPQSFLSQISSEIKARSRPPFEYQELPPLVPKSGRRMIPDSALNLTKANSLSPLNTRMYGESKRTPNKITPLYAPVPPKHRKLILTTVLPEPTKLLPSNFDVFKTNNDAYPTYRFIPKNRRQNLVPQAGKQKIILDSTELLIRSFLGRMNKGRPQAQKPYDFEVIKQKMNREGVKRRQMIHERVARRMNQKTSGRRNMNSDEVVYDSQELFKDPFLNDSLI
ncbi:unnamed protein product [Arctia plantaginis]|uniref:Uncharacterized protein n=1 Tax=Arctia plantaginis TaxID=874455 RepID=A0A8S1BMC5_ARCPL|nr:unnamed protein product [Arctia plantaginis]